jgi:CRP-like cAMP-binding protein
MTPDLEPVSLSLRQVLYEPGVEIKHLYFMEEGLCSILTVMEDGASVEVGMVGSDGMLGYTALLVSGQASANEVIVQVPGKALRIDYAAFKKAFDRSEGIRRVIFRCIGDGIMLGAQTAACNRLHSMEQRLARWLLMAADRIGSETMPMTHEFLAQMLGVRRAGVTLVAGELQRSGLIGYHHGTVTILNRDSLEETACECYHLDHKRLNKPIG